MARSCGTSAVVAMVLVAGGVLGPSAGSAQQAKKGDAPKAEASRPVEAIDPRGEPKQAVIKALAGPKVCVSHDRDGWQVQLRPGNADWTRIDGSIEVVGGELSRVSGFADLETATPGKKNEHADQGKYDKRHIEFRVWVKSGGMDTFRFYVSEGSQTLQFRFRVGGEVTAERILIGKEGRHPSRGEFALAAHPDGPPAPGGEAAGGAARAKSAGK